MLSDTHPNALQTSPPTERSPIESRRLVLRAARSPGAVIMAGSSIAALAAAGVFATSSLVWMGLALGAAALLVFTGLGLGVFAWAKARYDWTETELRYRVAASWGMQILGGITALLLASVGVAGLLGGMHSVLAAGLLAAALVVAGSMLWARWVDLPRLRRRVEVEGRGSMSG